MTQPENLAARGFFGRRGSETDEEVAEQGNKIDRKKGSEQASDLPWTNISMTRKHFHLQGWEIYLLHCNLHWNPAQGILLTFRSSFTKDYSADKTGEAIEWTELNSQAFWSEPLNSDTATSMAVFSLSTGSITFLPTDI